NNRLASNSLLEAIVLSEEMAKNISKEVTNITQKEVLPFSFEEFNAQGKIDITKEEITQLKKLLSKYFISNSGQDLYEIKQFLTVYMSYIKSVKEYSIAKHRFFNQVKLSKMLIDDRAGFQVRIEL